MEFIHRVIVLVCQNNSTVVRENAPSISCHVKNAQILARSNVHFSLDCTSFKCHLLLSAYTDTQNTVYCTYQHNDNALYKQLQSVARRAHGTCIPLALNHGAECTAGSLIPPSELCT